MKSKAVVLCSGGLASSVLAFLLGKEDRHSLDQHPSVVRQQLGLAPNGYTLHLLTINSQPCQTPRQRVARLMAAILDANYEVRDLSVLAPLPATAAATLPVRLVALAGAVALREGTMVIAAGSHVGSHFAQEWSTCATLFNQTTGTTMGIAFPHLQLLAPFAEMALHEIVALGVQLGVPLEHTWSCTQKVLDRQCGRCEACLARKAAFRQAGVADRTRYLHLSVAPVPRS